VTVPTLVIGNRNYSSWSLRAWLFLHASNVDFEERRVPLDTPTFRTTIAELSPTGCVPVLLDGSVRVWEALAICEYAADKYQLPGWPAESAARAEALAVAHEMHAGFAALRSELPMNCRARRTGVVPSPRAVADIERITAIWAGCRERYGAAGPFLFGDFGIADAMYAPVALRCLTYGVALPGAAAAYAAALTEHPSVRHWVAAAAEETESIPHEDRGTPLEVN
jgi:glutathione S-transferase